MNQNLDKTKKCWIAVALSIATFLAGTGARQIATSLGGDTIMTPVIVRTVLSVICIIVLGGAEWFHFDWSAVRRCWFYMWPLLLINVILGGMTLVGVVTATLSGEIDPQLTLRLGAYVTVLCLLVGINEEGMFRGLMFGGLLAKMGNREKGPFWAAVISSLAFGFAHVVFDLDFSNMWSIGSGAMKTIETAMFAFILCAPVLESNSLWGAALLHGLFDWIILVGNTIASGEITTPTYVAQDPEVAKAAMLMFGLMVILYLPKTWRAGKDLLAMELPQEGPFV